MNSYHIAIAWNTCQALLIQRVMAFIFNLTPFYYLLKRECWAFLVHKNKRAGNNPVDKCKKNLQKIKHCIII